MRGSSVRPPASGRPGGLLRALANAAGGCQCQVKQGTERETRKQSDLEEGSQRGTQAVHRQTSTRPNESPWRGVRMSLSLSPPYTEGRHIAPPQELKPKQDNEENLRDPPAPHHVLDEGPHQV